MDTATYTFGGHDYQLAGLRIADRMEFKRQIAEQRREAFEEIKAAYLELPESLQEAARDDLMAAFRRSAGGVAAVTDDDVAEYLNTEEGAIEMLFVMLSKCHPAMTREEAERLARGAHARDKSKGLLAAIQQANLGHNQLVDAVAKASGRKPATKGRRRAK